MALALVNGVEMNFSDSGEKDLPPIVLIHGFPLSVALWHPQQKALKGKARVIAYDIRGHGHSGVGDGQYTIDLFVDDLFALMDSLSLPKAALCGLSMGGYIALRAVERSPERVSALVLCDTRSEADSDEARLKRADAMRAVKKDGSAAFGESFIKGLFAPASLASVNPEVFRIKRVIAGNPPLGIAGALLAMAARSDTTASLSKIKVPTLVLVGAEDALTPPAAAEKLKGAISRARLGLISGAGHLSNLDNPAEFNRLLLDFLATL